MKQIFRNLVAYAVELSSLEDSTPDQIVETLNDNLPTFEPIGEHQTVSSGFEPVVLDGNLAQCVFGGWALRYRMDVKSVPAAEVNKELQLRKAAVYESTGRLVGKKEAKELKAEIIHDLLPRAFPRQSGAVVVFSPRTGHLYVNTASQKVCDRLMTELVASLDSLKTKTLHVSEPKSGLTNRLTTWLRDEEDVVFGGLSPRDEIVMKATGGKKWSIKVDHLLAARAALEEAMRHNATVDSIGFVNDEGVRFRITSALRVKGLSIPAAAPDKDLAGSQEEGALSDLFCAQIGVEVSVLDEIFTGLLKLFATAPAEEPAEQDNLEDLL